MQTHSTTGDSPRAAGFHMPAEWEPHAACWLAWPASEELWGKYLTSVRSSFVALCAAIVDADPGTRQPHGEELRVLACDETGEAQARAALRQVPGVFFCRIPYGDIWLRDTAPIFLRGGDGSVATARFAFNGWGGKYLFAHDGDVAARIALLSGLRSFHREWVLEGGSIDCDGEGTCLTTRQCLLNPNRNPGMDQRAIEAALMEGLGVERVLWLDRGLLNDHTDGHVDTIARFVAPGTIVCMRAAGAGDPNRATLDATARDLASFRDARGRRLEVIHIPSPGPIQDAEGELVPASYVNFYVGNRTVVVPTYGSTADGEAVATIGACFPGRRAVGIPAAAMVAGGGGAFHCITQQQPAGGGMGNDAT